MNVNLYNTKDYENINDWTLGENKANSKPISRQKADCRRQELGYQDNRKSGRRIPADQGIRIQPNVLYNCRESSPEAGKPLQIGHFYAKQSQFSKSPK
jgi:hypothetical protein